MHDWAVNNSWFINAPVAAGAVGGLVLIAVLWSMVWKGLALWHASRNGQQWWFVIMLLVNTVGILEIIYLFGIAKLRFNQLFTKGPHHHKHHQN